MNKLFIPPEGVEAYGESTARSLVSQSSISARQAGQSLKSSLARLLRAREALREKYGEESGPEAARWLLDNGYLARRECAQALEDLRGVRTLRSFEGEAMILTLCKAMLVSGLGQVDGERCLAFLRGFQKKIILSGEELSLIPAGLRAGAVMQLSRLYGEEEPDARMAGALFGTLRLWSTLDTGPLLEKADLTEQALRQDPAGIYARMDEGSRLAYRRQAERLARRRGIPACRAAQRALRLASEGKTPRERHVGYYLFARPMGEAPAPRRGSGYIAANILIPLFLTLLAGFLLHSPGAALLLWLPLWQLVKTVTDHTAARLSSPRHLPRLALKEGVPPEGRTICVISALLGDEKAAPTALRRLEEFRLCSRDCGENLLFGLLCDLPEDERACTPEDSARIRDAARRVRELNRSCGGGFYLFTRERVWSRDTSRFAGWERKRGAILELCRLLCGEKTSLRAEAGDAAALRGTRYILTLDADTRLQPESARQLIGAMLHPLNTPVIDPARGLVIAGHGIIQPRIAVELESSGRSLFSRIFAGQGGTDPYGGDAGELYMDMTDSGGFAGKGILDARAMLRCMEKRIPEGRVLSHDALEGAFLRGGFMGDTELTDSFPGSISGYFRRMHRWIRGDFQNSPWIFRPGRVLPPIERWRLFDSLRRAVTPPAMLLGLSAGLWLPAPAMVWVGVMTLFCFFTPLLSALLRACLRREEDPPQRLMSHIFHGVCGAAAETLLRLLLLPLESWVCLSAGTAALWRMLFSHRNLLLWQTAAQCDAAGGRGPRSCYRQMRSLTLTGAAFLLLCPSVPGRVLGLIWLSAPGWAAALGRDRSTKRELSQADRDFLLQQARAVWNYFDSFCREEDHFLPPDNFQASPPVGIAHRTSPTNIGLGLVSILCALDLGLTGRQRAGELWEGMLDTVEALPRWQGHLFNWYDTRTLRPLTPVYVSTVDSGNLAASLLVLEQGLREHRFPELEKRVRALRLAMDFRPLFDESRQLFRIGLTPGDRNPPESWYDLLESEARLTAYYAIASGQVPRRHWRRLSRAQLGMDGFRGMASWTGTMFEYLMPELYLPLYRDSLLYESARFALYVQRKRRAGEQQVWGISESAFASLDVSLSYRYKAHGCGALALCRDMDGELVISPYSSFLALVLSPAGAIENLRRLEATDMPGPYGFWEALDFTPSRCPGGEGQAVRCVMAHHLGMSLAAATNALLDNLLPRRFMADPAMAAYQGLLQEKVPIGGALLRRRPVTPPERPRPGGLSGAREGNDIDFAAPVCTALSNGVYHLVVTESGLSRASCGGVLPYACPRKPLGDGQGPELFWIQEGKPLSLLPRPGAEGEFRWRLSAGEGVHYGSGGGLDWSVTARVSRECAGELRLIRVQRPEDSPEARLLLQLEPLLVSERDYRAQPSFARLGLHSEIKDGILLFRRLPRKGTEPLYLALGCSRTVLYASDLRAAGGRNGLPLSPQESSGWQSEPRITAQVSIPAGEAETELCFALCVASRGEEAAEGVRAMLSSPQGFSMAGAGALSLGMDDRAVTGALDALTRLVFPIPYPELSAAPPVSREALWAMGLSGDLPLVCVESLRESTPDAALCQIRRQGLLALCGVSYDLVILTEDGGDYLRPRQDILEKELRRLGRDGLTGRPGGIYFLTPEQGKLLTGRAAEFIRSSGGEALPDRHTGLPRGFFPPEIEGGLRPEGCWEKDGGYTLRTRGSLPPRSWGRPLTNGRLGWFASDCGTGSLWFENARECPLIPWRGDPLSWDGPERLWAETDRERVSLFARPGQDTEILYAPGFVRWVTELSGGRITLTAFIPPDRDLRVFLLESTVPCRILWCAPLQLSPEPEDASAVTVSMDNGILSAESPCCRERGLRFYAGCSRPWLSVGGDENLWLTGQECSLPHRGAPAFGVSFSLEDEAVLVCGTESPGPLLTPASARSALEETQRLRVERLSLLWAETPSPALDRFLQLRAADQALSCRIMARSSLYQSGGAMGFRDQLQDRVNLIPIDPEGCREQILLSCAHQYREGDVQHWFHPGVGGADKGVRTRCSDDLLWLPWALCRYVEQTGDEALCRESREWLCSPPLSPEEESRYESPELLGPAESVLAHCRKAIELVLRRGVGAHGLLHMGGGDWNDGFDGMGEGAESVWLSWFFSLVAHDFSRLLERLGEPDGEKYEKAAEMLGRAADRAWDGDHYLRGYYGDGHPLGGRDAPACRVDSIAQSFAVFSPYADRERSEQALDTALRELWDRENHIVRLYTPPFAQGERSPGYVSSYGPGFRENGGQYTHAALWLAMACFRRGRSEEGLALLLDCLPGERDTELYGAEPFSIPADIYDGDQIGRAGWSWYTGSAGWFFSVAYRELLGLRLRDGQPELSPCLPPDWQRFRGFYRGREFGFRDGKSYLL